MADDENHNQRFEEFEEGENMSKSIAKSLYILRRVCDLDWRFLLIIFIPSLFLLIFLTLSSFTTFNSFSNYIPLRSIFSDQTSKTPPLNTTVTPSLPSQPPTSQNETLTTKDKLNRSRIAVCLVGGARRFDLTGPTIVENILKVYPNSDLFLHSPLDANSFKFSLLKIAPRLASVTIFRPTHIQETESQLRVLSSSGSPNGIQGLLQYFNLVEGCLTLVEAYQERNNFTYDWIVRTRVDGYWTTPLDPEHFIPGHYVIPSGSSYGGLNDRLGVGDVNTSIVALSRLSLIQKLLSAGFHQLNSESAFKAQLTTQGVPYVVKRIPFCIVSDRRYGYPPGVPVASLSSRGPLSGAKCRGCTPVCEGPCVEEVMRRLSKGWSWTDWGNGSLQLCDARGGWENGWEKVFDRVAGKQFAEFRQRVSELKLNECVNDFEEMRKGTTGQWDAPDPAEICSLGMRPA